MIGENIGEKEEQRWCPSPLAQPANVPGMAATASGECNKRATSEPGETQSVRLDTGRGTNTEGQEPGSEKREKNPGE